MRYRLMATYRGVPYEAGTGPASADVVLFAACPPPEELGFEPAPGHWRKRVMRAEIDALWESRPVGVFRGEPCIVLDDLGDRLHIAYLGTDPARAAMLGYWQVDRGVFELLALRDEITGLAEERVDRPLRWAGPPPDTGLAPAYPYSTAPWPATAATGAGGGLRGPGPAGPANGSGSGSAAGQPPGYVDGSLPGMPGPPALPGPPGFPLPSPGPVGGFTVNGALWPEHGPAWPGPSAGGMPGRQPPASGPAAHPPLPGSPPPGPPPAGSGPGLEPAGPGLPGPGPCQAPAPWDTEPGRAGSAPRDATSQPGIPLRDATASHPGLPVRDTSGNPAPPLRETTGGYPVLAGPGSPGGSPGQAARQTTGSHAVPLTRAMAAGQAAAQAAAARAPRAATAQPPGSPPAGSGPPGTGIREGGGRSARRQRVTTRTVFCELADLAAIPRHAYALEEESDGAMCLLRTGAGYEVFLAAHGARHEARSFADEEAAYFYLFGVLAAEAIRNGGLAPH